MSVEALAERIGQCDRDRIRVSIVGGNTLRGMGKAVMHDHEIISAAGLAQIVNDAPADLVICAQAGVTVRNLSIALAKHRTHIPFDAPLPSTATLGGTIAAGWLGPRRHLYGRVRDYLLGSVAILASGTVVRAGGIVVKNVAGYDLSRLYAGSFGTLAVLAQVNLKTLPMPNAARAFIAPLIEGTRERAIEALATLPTVPAAAFWIEGFRTAVDGEDGSEGRMFVLIEAGDRILDRATRDLRSALGKAGVPETRVIDTGARESFERIVDAYVSNVGERSISYRITGIPENLTSRTAALRVTAANFELRADSLVDLMNGDIIFRVSDLDSRALAAKIEMFDDALHDLESRATIVAGDHPSRGLLNVWGEPPAALDRMRALKSQFDPHATLNPGRFVGGI